MEKLLDMARAEAEKAEVLMLETRTMPFNVYNCVGNDILETETREVSLRIVKDGRLGEAKGSFTGKNRKAFLEDAVRSAKFGPKVALDFAGPGKPGGGKIYDPKLAALTPEEMAAVGWTLLDKARRKAPDILLNLYMNREVKKYHLMSTAGADASYEQTIYTVCLLHMFPGSKEGVNKELVECRYFDYPE
ncbi:MAG: hypothetical protein MUC63_06325, partial [Planctomycetes bacterium]|nr:hypothetical protein [Planctomycetota bacterium]